MGRGRRQLATTAERREVRRLAEEGGSVRAIASAVFGDARYRGRVERILRSPLAGPHAPLADGEVEIRAGGEAEALRRLIRRELVRLGERELSVGELATLVRIQRQLEAADRLERANALTRRT